MMIGYMRVSTADERQSVDLQRDALVAAGVDERHLHQDKASGARDDRPGLKACLADLRSGDILVVWKLDRLGRSLSHLLRIVTELKERGVVSDEEKREACCYALQDKFWLTDPDGNRWEIYTVLEDLEGEAAGAQAACCAR